MYRTNVTRQMRISLIRLNVADRPLTPWEKLNKVIWRRRRSRELFKCFTGDCNDRIILIIHLVSVCITEHGRTGCAEGDIQNGSPSDVKGNLQPKVIYQLLWLGKHISQQSSSLKFLSRIESLVGRWSSDSVMKEAAHVPPLVVVTRGAYCLVPSSQFASHHQPCA